MNQTSLVVIPSGTERKWGWKDKDLRQILMKEFEEFDHYNFDNLIKEVASTEVLQS